MLVEGDAEGVSHLQGGEEGRGDGRRVGERGGVTKVRNDFT